MKNNLIGAWSLVSCDVRAGDRILTRPFGINPTGLIIFSDSGFMSVIITPGLSSEESSLQQQGPTSVLAFAGTYEIEADAVTYHALMSIRPELVGTDQVRLFAVSKDKLLLRTRPQVVNGEEQFGNIVWQRCEPPSRISQAESHRPSLQDQ
jgi:hypothetical protein